MKTMTNIKIAEDNAGFDDMYDILKHVTQVHGTIKEAMSEDYVLAKLSETDREGIINTVTNAYHLKKVLEKYKFKIKSRNTSQDKEDIKKVQEMTQKTYDMMMQKCHATSVLNRNLPANSILGILGDRDVSGEKETTIKDAIKSAASENNLKKT